jgi:hypothetical protein
MSIQDPTTFGIDVPQLSATARLIIAARIFESYAKIFEHQAEVLKRCGLAEAQVRVTDHALETMKMADWFRQQARGGKS